MNKALEETIHNLKNVRTIQNVIEYNITKLAEKSKRLNRRVNLLEQQIDQLVKKGAK